MAIILQTTRYNVIYVFSRTAHPGALKIGKTSVDAYDVSELTPNCEKLKQAAYERFRDSVTYGVNDLTLQYTEVAYFQNSQGKAFMFDDHAVHDVLLNSNFKKKDFGSDIGNADEWFYVDLEHAIRAIDAVKHEQSRIDGPKIEIPSHPVICFRDEQKAAIEATVSHYKQEGAGARMLWNAKMRFGKTLCALELVNRLDVEKVLILTHRPTVRDGWFDDYHLIDFKNYQYGSKSGSARNSLYDKENDLDGYRKGKDLKTMLEDLENGTHFIYFASMQDLRGQEKDENGNYVWKDNNKLVYETDWDLIIFDEAHEGTQTKLGKQVSSDLCKHHDPLKLYLSGTPYNIFSQFEENEIYTWDYVMEQDAKEKWGINHPNKPNPYEGLAQMHIYTYNLGELFENNPDYTKTEDDFFNFAEFFRVWSGDKQKDGRPMPQGTDVGSFVHEQDVISFLDLLCQEMPVSYYPYSNNEFRKALSHTLWMLPGVDQANRLAFLINQHKLHTEFGYEVVSVAGEGFAIENAGENIKAIEKKEKDALERVRKAIKKNSKTITLSCGRLTTGVSVPEWTGVFLLSGGYSTSAASYMQTIFRGQTPFKNGAIKSNCYAFDFAPDRTLTVFDDYIKQQRGSKNSPRKPGDDIERTANSLRFMPIVSMVGGKEIEYDARSLINKVNEATAELVFSHGFKHKKLHRNFATFTEQDYQLLEQLDKKLGGAKVPVSNDGTIILSNEGFTGENGGKNEPKNSTRGTKGTRTGATNQPPKRKAPHDEELERRRRSQNVFDKILVRLPLLLFGSITDSSELIVNEKINIDFIDDESWNEFMPAGFTKPIFKQLEHLVSTDLLIACTDKIIKDTTAADELPIEKRIVEIARIVSTFHFPDKETILTPWRVVNMHMTDTIGGYDFYNEKHTVPLGELRLVEQGDITSTIFCNPDTKILEINSKSGVYPLWLACTLWKLLGHKGMTGEEEWALWKKVLEENLYIVCKTSMAEKITRRVLIGYKSGIKPNTVYFENLIDRIKDVDKRDKLIEEICNPKTYNNNTENNMLKFSAVVGNPPYQEIKSSKKSTVNSAFASALYPLFFNAARKISPQYISMIMPSRWMTKTGQGISDNWVDEMINNDHFLVLHDFIYAQDCFPKVDLKGGVCYFLYTEDYVGKCQYSIHKDGNTSSNLSRLNEKGFGIVIRDFEAIKILERIKCVEGDYLEESFATLVSPQHFFDKDGQLGTSWKGYSKEKDTIHNIKFYLNKNLESQGYAWVSQSDVPKNLDVKNLHKVYIPEAGGSGSDPIVLGMPFYGEPNSICSQTYIVIGYDANQHCFTKEECFNIISYIKTRFFRFLVSIKKSTQHGYSQVYQFVPLQDFSHPWTDEMLYEKYKLTPDEIAYIETLIKPMADSATPTEPEFNIASTNCNNLIVNGTVHIHGNVYEMQGKDEKE